MARFRDSAEFGPTLDAVSENLDISATAVEKDYWVSEVLRVLIADFRDDFMPGSEPRTKPRCRSSTSAKIRSLAGSRSAPALRHTLRCSDHQRHPTRAAVVSTVTRDMCPACLAT